MLLSLLYSTLLCTSFCVAILISNDKTNDQISTSPPILKKMTNEEFTLDCIKTFNDKLIFNTTFYNLNSDLSQYTPINLANNETFQPPRACQSIQNGYDLTINNDNNIMQAIIRPGVTKCSDIKSNLYFGSWKSIACAVSLKSSSCNADDCNAQSPACSQTPDASSPYFTAACVGDF